MRTRLLPLLTATLIAYACGSDAPTGPDEPMSVTSMNGNTPACPKLPPKTRGLIVSPSMSEVAVGGTVALTVTNQAGVPIPACALKWSSNRPALAAVAQEGTVTGVAVGGPVIVTVKAREKKTVKGHAAVTVIPAIVPLASLELIYAERDNTALNIYAMMGDGTGRRPISAGTGPTWHGNRILARGAFQDNSIYGMDSSGANRQLIVGSGPSYAPDFSPDGARFTFLHGDCGGGHSIATANLDGSGLTILPICATSTPRWSPVGDRLAYAVGPTIYTALVDGSDIRSVATLTGDVSGATWSPDGARLLFSYAPSGSTYAHIFMVNTDGTNLLQISDAPADDWVQDWSSTGDWVLYFSNRSGSLDLWAMRTDGTSEVNLTSGRAPPDAAQWKK